MPMISRRIRKKLTQLMTGNAIFGLLTMMQLQSSNNTPVLRSIAHNNAWISCKMMRSSHRCWIRASLSLRNKHTWQGIPQLLRWNTMNGRGEEILLNWRYHSAEKKLICPDRSWESRIINSWFRSRIGGASGICILNKILIVTLICSTDETFYNIPFDRSQVSTFVLQTMKLLWSSFIGITKLQEVLFWFEAGAGSDTMSELVPQIRKLLLGNRCCSLDSRRNTKLGLRSCCNSSWLSYVCLLRKWKEIDSEFIL